MPEGDTIHYAANRIRPVLAGQVPDELATPHRRFARDRWPERLAGRAVTAVDAVGKHLLLRFEGGLTIHSHLRMTGAWRVVDREASLPPVPALRASPPAAPSASPRAWLVIRRGDRQVVQLNGPVLELMTESRTRLDQRIAGLGPDVLAPELDEARFLRRLREDDPTRPIGDALIDQRTIAGIGNLWKVEGCFAAGVDPWRQTGRVTDDEALAVVAACRTRMQQSVRDGHRARSERIYGRAGRHCPRCGPEATIHARGQSDDNRPTFWCPRCQR